jgi:hypothetical protein
MVAVAVHAPHQASCSCAAKRRCSLTQIHHTECSLRRQRSRRQHIIAYCCSFSCLVLQEMQQHVSLLLSSQCRWCWHAWVASLIIVLMQLPLHVCMVDVVVCCVLQTYAQEGTATQKQCRTAHAAVRLATTENRALDRTWFARVRQSFYIHLTCICIQLYVAHSAGLGSLLCALLSRTNTSYVQC